ncbi:FixH family protein [Paenibacillus monticola]|uniref:YtkA-like domain-containing protein n=1 Tax=Paenibacillus monticola TaxID=2666075 RepID=A0A7X2L2U0_9BACL|nr:FixH family protein [Paenibacillus monticola]MRN54565.1 hypothetical protein [Paenibacillus monticola]
MMIRRKMVFLLSVVTILGLGGCSSGSHGQSHMNSADLSMVAIKVELHWNPDEVSVNQKVTFEAAVTQDDQPVDDAKEVKFEIVNKADATQNLELNGKSAGNGLYKAEGVLKLEGLYTVTSHVTARTQHSMPSKELTVQP